MIANPATVPTSYDLSSHHHQYDSYDLSSVRDAFILDHDCELTGLQMLSR